MNDEEAAKVIGEIQATLAEKSDVYLLGLLRNGVSHGAKEYLLMNITGQSDGWIKNLMLMGLVIDTMLSRHELPDEKEI